MATSVTDEKDAALLDDAGAAQIVAEAKATDDVQQTERTIEEAPRNEPLIAPIEVAEALLSQLVRTVPKLDRVKLDQTDAETSRHESAEVEPPLAWAEAPTLAASRMESSEPDRFTSRMAEDYDWRSSEPVVASPPFVADSAAAASNKEPRATSTGTFAVLAASMAIAAALGAMGGALGASGLVRLGPAPSQAAVAPVAAAPSDETRALQSAMAQLRTDLVALKSSLEAGTKSTNGQIANANNQIAKMAERFDRLERAQAEPAAKITKAIETLERLEKRNDPPKETTGSVPAVQQQAAVVSGQPQTVNGWSVREVYRGIAVLQGPRFGLIEVEAGDTVPGIGRVEAVRRQDGRWVVVTSKGVIKSSSR